MQDEHRPRALADDEVALPVASLAAVFNGLSDYAVASAWDLE